MRRVLSFLVWLFSFWTWKDFFLRWLRSPAHSSGESAEHLPSQEGQPESELARFLSSLPEDERRCDHLSFDEDSEVIINFGPFKSFTLFHGTGEQAEYREFLEAVASSEIVFREEVRISLNGDKSCKHAEAFADALRQSGNGFKNLYFACWYGSAVRFSRSVSSVLLRNVAIQELTLDFHSLEGEMGKEAIREFMAIFAVPHNLRILKSFGMDLSNLDGEGTKQLMKSFQGPPSVVEDLRFDIIASDAQLEHISDMLASSTSLKTLSVNIFSSGVKKKDFTRGFTSIAVALRFNQSLKSLTCGISSSWELQALLDPLMPKANNLQCNTTLTELTLWGSIGGKEGVETLVDMLRSNSSLLELGLFFVDDLSSDDTEQIENVLTILEALKTNKFLKRIDFLGCKAVGGYKVLGAMMDLLLENHCIEDIHLSRTGLEEMGDADYVYSALSKRRKVRLWDIVQGMANVKPTSGRVFLCGNPYAGKTTLRMSMKDLKEFQGKNETQIRSRFREKIKRAFKPSNALKLLTKDIHLERTHGIEVDSVQCDDVGITIWDMAGQTDYHSFHELVMPNLSADGSCSMFLLMCNPMEQSSLSGGPKLSSIKGELESWLRFIASNTRRSLSFRPHVSIVMTHFDYWKDDHAFATRIDDVVLELKSQFEEVLEFDEDKSVFKVNGRDISHARGVFDFIKLHLKQLLERLPKTMSACEEVQCLVALWNAEKSPQMLLKWDEFCEGLCKEVEELNDVDDELAKRRKEFVAMLLNDGGHIIYNEQEGVVITNPHWFCHHIIGQFLHRCAIEGHRLDMVSSNGIMSIGHVRRLILSLIEGQGDMEKQFDAILGMMIKLHICYEQDAHHIIIPSTLTIKLNNLSWSRHDEATSFTYIGRRLACKDGTRTMLTPGFFTRLQVSFFKMLQSKNAQDTYQVFQDVIKFISEGIEAILEFNDGDIDILLRSHQCQDKMMEFLENGILMHIKHLQSNPTLGCPGVLLEDYILRPACVEKLLHRQHRKNQFVHMKDLELEVIKNGVDATHNWKSCEGLDVGFNKVETLLGGLAWKKLLERRSCHLQEYHRWKEMAWGTYPIEVEKCREAVKWLCNGKGIPYDSHRRYNDKLYIDTICKEVDNILCEERSFASYLRRAKTTALERVIAKRRRRANQRVGIKIGVMIYINKLLRLLFAFSGILIILLSVILDNFFNGNPVRSTAFAILAPAMISLGFLASGWFPRIPLRFIAFLKRCGFLQHVVACSPWHDNVVTDFCGKICILEPLEQDEGTRLFEIPTSVQNFLNEDRFPPKKTTLTTYSHSTLDSDIQDCQAATSPLEIQGQDVQEVSTLNPQSQDSETSNVPDQAFMSEILERPRVVMATGQVSSPHLQEAPSRVEDIVVETHHSPLFYVLGDERAPILEFEGPKINGFPLKVQAFKNTSTRDLTFDLFCTFRNKKTRRMNLITERLSNLVQNMCQWVEMPYPIVVDESSDILHCIAIQDILWAFTKGVYTFNSVRVEHRFVAGMEKDESVFFVSLTLVCLVVGVIPLVLDKTSNWFLLFLIVPVAYALSLMDFSYYFRSLFGPICLKYKDFRSLYKSKSSFICCNEFGKKKIVNPKSFWIDQEYANKHSDADSCFDTNKLVILPSNIRVEIFKIACQGWPEDDPTKCKKQHDYELEVNFDTFYPGDTCYTSVKLLFCENGDPLGTRQYGSVEIQRLQLIEKLFHCYSNPSFGGYVDTIRPCSWSQSYLGNCRRFLDICDKIITDCTMPIPWEAATKPDSEFIIGVPF